MRTQIEALEGEEAAKAPQETKTVEQVEEKAPEKPAAAPPPPQPKVTRTLSVQIRMPDVQVEQKAAAEADEPQRPALRSEECVASRLKIGK